MLRLTDLQPDPLPPSSLYLACPHHGEIDDLSIFPFLKVRQLWDRRWVLHDAYGAWRCTELNCRAFVSLQCRFDNCAVGISMRGQNRTPKEATCSG